MPVTFPQWYRNQRSVGTPLWRLSSRTAQTIGWAPFWSLILMKSWILSLRFTRRLMNAWRSHVWLSLCLSVRHRATKSQQSNIPKKGVSRPDCGNKRKANRPKLSQNIAIVARVQIPKMTRCSGLVMGLVVKQEGTYTKLVRHRLTLQIPTHGCVCGARVNSRTPHE